MSTLESLTFAGPLIRDQVRRGHSHKVIAQELQQQCPSLRGLSARSVRRFAALTEFTVLAVCPPMRSTVPLNNVARVGPLLVSRASPSYSKGEGRSGQRSYQSRSRTLPLARKRVWCTWAESSVLVLRCALTWPCKARI